MTPLFAVDRSLAISYVIIRFLPLLGGIEMEMIIKLLQKITLPFGLNHFFYQDKNHPLSPWPFFYLMIGNSNGKTSLLHAAQLKETNAFPFSSDHSYNKVLSVWSENSLPFAIVDVPMHYFKEQLSFLDLLQNEKKNLAGIIMTISVLELNRIDEQDSTFNKMVHFLTTTGKNLPCHIMVTQCDLIPGFREFFAESSINELYSSFGFSLKTQPKAELQYHIYREHFHQLLKKLNRQLINRLHQELNPDIKHLIKEFPLAMEKIKDSLFAVIKRINWLSVHFTSAKQMDEDEKTFSTEFDNQSLQIFNTVSASSQPYFIRQLLTKNLIRPNSPSVIKKVKLAIYMITFILFSIFALFLLTDFVFSRSDFNTVNRQLISYRQLNHKKDPVKELMALESVLSLLKTKKEMNLFPLSFFKDTVKSRINMIYQQTVDLLVEDCKKYLEFYLKNSDNRNGNTVYAALKAYLMLGEPIYFDENYFINVFQSILPAEINYQQKRNLKDHLRALFKNKTRHSIKLSLNENLVKSKREFLSNLTGFQLGYVILKNMNINQVPLKQFMDPIDRESMVFSYNENLYIPYLYTKDMFHWVYFIATKKAAEEAITGNWVLGDEFKTTPSNEIVESLREELQNVYVEHYIKSWKQLASNIHLLTTNNLLYEKNIIHRLISTPSPLLLLLQMINEHIHFDQAIKVNAEFAQLNEMVSHPQDSRLLKETFMKLSFLDNFLDNELFSIMQNDLELENIRQQIINLAKKNPIPLNHLLLEIANNLKACLLLHNTNLDIQSFKAEKMLPDLADSFFMSHYGFKSYLERVHVKNRNDQLS